MSVFPKEYIDNMKLLLNNDYDKYESSFAYPAKRGLRVNKGYIKTAEFCDFFPFDIQKLPVADNLFELKSTDKIGNTIFHHSGMIYLQEPSSMLASLALGVQEGEKVLDLCSAPGGKSGQILESNTTGIVVSNEIVRSRASVLLSNIERQGFKNSVITSLSPQSLAELLPNYFDKILVDAPCSGEGMFRKDPSTIAEWNCGLPEFNHQRQLEILKSADKMLVQGGRLVYSTCTFNLKEDEETVAKFIKDCGYRILPLPDNIKQVMTPGKDVCGEKTSLSAKCFPFNNFGEGQFVAVLEKVSDNCTESVKKKVKNISPNKKEIEIAKDFLNRTISDVDFYFYKLGDNVYISKQPLPVLSYGVVSAGVCLGEIKKDRIEPAHQFFKAYGKLFKNKIDLSVDDTRAVEYIKGLEIECDNTNGYACVCVNGVPLGGGKVVNKRLKNHYPKGLRV